MKARHKGQMAAGLILIVLALVLLAFVPNVRAMSLNYNDSIWTNLSVKGPDVTKPGNNETYTVSGLLAVNMTGSVHITIWANSTSQTTEVLLSQYVLAPQFWMAAAFIQSYTVLIPRDAANNQYVYVTLDAGTSHMTNVAVSLIQNPTYPDLQAQVDSLTSSLNSLQQNYTILNNAFNSVNAQLSSLQNTYNSLYSTYGLLVNSSQTNSQALLGQVSDLSANNTLLSQQIGNLTKQLGDLNFTLLNNITSLQSNKTALENQLEDLQTQLGGLQANNSLLQSELGDSELNSTSLSAQMLQLQTDNGNLQAQVSTLETTLETNQTAFENQTSIMQDQLDNMQLNATNLQSLASDLQNQTLDLQQRLLASQSQTRNLQAKNVTASTLVDATLGTTVAFAAVTGYVVVSKVKRPGKAKNKSNEDAQLF